ncbi:filamin-A-interacting protein 1-like [Gadus macrocephalus]|uniref:filamin-A-interacting protein 1-like n=1 Tax=Gadus macrocephalus TaxID=80720 RepID=UPI0028CB5026|nr:filamin-A-interacting protein 1-like [Gadus macrocephalus]
MPVHKGNIPHQNDINQWHHLKNIHLPELDCEIELLIGSDVPKALEPLQVIRSVGDGPYAVKTMLGWTVNGPLGGKGDYAQEQSEISVNRISVGKTECTQLNTALEREKGLTKELSGELVALRIRMKEVESSELRLEKSELSLKDDLSKLKSLTVTLMDERKNLMDRMKSEEKKKEDLGNMFKIEQRKVTEVTERLIDESKKFLKLKSEMGNKVETLTSENRELSTKILNELDTNKDLNCKINQLKKRLDGLDPAEKSPLKNIGRCELGRGSGSAIADDNKLVELTFEIEELKKRLKQLEVVEGDLIKTEDQCDLLKKKFLTEQDKANILSRQIEEMRSQIARNKAIEKGEEDCPREDLQQCCKREEAMTKDLQADVVALKEKIHELMNKEDQLSQLQLDYSVLQQRFLEEEEKAKNMSIEVIHLTKELDVTKRQSRALRPSMNGRRMMDIAMTSTAVQTDVLPMDTAEEDCPAVFIRKSVQEENHIMNNFRQKCLRKSSEKLSALERSPSSTSDMGVKKSWIPWMRKKETAPPGDDHGPCRVQGHARKADGPGGHQEVPPGQFQKEDLYARRRWRQVQYMSDLFWKRWIKEYLPQLQERQKWSNIRRNFTPGDIVIIVDDSAPRNSWLTGRIVETIMDKKGLVRQLRIKSKTGFLTRPITKVCLLLEAADH